MESVLRDAHDPSLRVFVVWEPVLLTDWHAPSAAALARIPDTRAVQYWDRGHVLSAEIRRAAQSNAIGVLGTHRLRSLIVWDFVGIYPPGVRWDNAFPAAEFAGAPVVRVIDDVRAAISPEARPAPAPALEPARSTGHHSLTAAARHAATPDRPAY